MMISLSDVVAHLWQSTLFAAVVGLATLLLRRNHAAIRHSLWLAASIKFLVPFAALAALGATFGPRFHAPERVFEVVFVQHAGGPDVMPLWTQIAPRPVPVKALPPLFVAGAGAVWLCGLAIIVAIWCIRWRRIAAIARRSSTLAAGREVDALRKIEQRLGVVTPIRMLTSDSSIEPGVFGFLRPILLWPRAIGDRLDDEQLATILAHEVAHVRRRDNLLAALHMAVQAIFWFHPGVWWIGARLVDERERACDEMVVRLGHEPQVYAETILKACRMFLESPLTCMAGVTGSDLSKRIERIMTNVQSEALTPMRKVLVTAVPVLAVLIPVIVGVLNAPPIRAQQASAPTSLNAEFEVASVKMNKSGLAGKVSIQTLPGGRFSAENVTLRQLIRNAYMLQDVQIAGGPKWLDEERFDIVAKAVGDRLGDPFVAEQTREPSRWQVMLRALLTDRFKLMAHREPREMPYYALLVSRRDGPFGPSLKRSDVDCSTADGQKQCGLRLMPGNMTANSASMTQLANSLAAFVGRIVFDRTQLQGNFDFTLKWTPDQIPAGLERKAAAMNLPPIDPDGPSIFTALQEQLGLKLDAVKGPVDVLVIDRAEHPTEN
jgi:bla regulator protein blaR1